MCGAQRFPWQAVSPSRESDAGAVGSGESRSVRPKSWLGRLEIWLPPAPFRAGGSGALPALWVVCAPGAPAGEPLPFFSVGAGPAVSGFPREWLGGGGSTADRGGAVGVVGFVAPASFAVFREGALDEPAGQVGEAVFELGGPLVADLPIGERLVDPLFPGSDDRGSDIFDSDTLILGDCFDRAVRQQLLQLAGREAERPCSGLKPGPFAETILRGP